MAGAASSPRHPTSSARPLGIAIVGCGQIVTHHCDALAALVAASAESDGDGGGERNSSGARAASFRVVALCDPSPDRRRIVRELCDEGGLLTTMEEDGGDSSSSSSGVVSEFDTLDDLLAAEAAATAGGWLWAKVDVDVVFVAVPHDLHVEVATKSLRSGKHVVLEKPLAPTIEGCRSLRDTAEIVSSSSLSGGPLLFVAEQSPYWEEIVLARKMIDDGKIGRLVSAAAYYYESMRDNITSGKDEDGGLGWRRSLKRCGGGIVIDGGLHWIRPLRELCGDIVSVVGTTENAEPGLRMEGETLAHALFKIQRKGGGGEEGGGGGRGRKEPQSAEPLVATFSANFMHTAPMAHDVCPYFRLTGTGGELVVYGTGLNPKGGGGLRIYDNEHPSGRDLFPPDRHGGFFLGFRGLWHTAIDAIRSCDQEVARRTVRDAAADVSVALAIYRSAESGRWEPCELWES